MAESYTGDEGDDALADGMDILDGTEDWRDGWRAINKTRDYIVQKVAAIVVPTWATLTGKPATFPPSTHTHSASQITSGTITRPVDTAGDVRTTGLLRAADDFYASGESFQSGTIHAGDDIDVDGHVFVPSATAATSSYAVAYINGDGRLSKNASSERFKKYISEVDPATLGDIWPAFHRFQMRGGDSTWKYGYIAERLAEHPEQQVFTVYDAAGSPESIDFIALLMAQVAQLHQRVTELENG